MFEWTADGVRTYGNALSYTLAFVFCILLVLVLLGRLRFQSVRKSFFLLFGLVCFSFFVRLPFAWMNELSYDEPLYISASLLYMEGFGEGIGSNKFMANYEHPPLVKYLLGAYLKIWCPNAHLDYGSEINDFNLLFYARLFSVFMGSISIIPLYLLAEKTAPHLGIPASVFFALNPSHARLSGLAYLDVPMIFFGLCSILATLYLLEKTTLKKIILCGVFNGLLIGTKWIQPVLFVIPMLVFIAIFHRRKFPIYVLTWVISLTTLMLLWLPLIYRLGLNLIPLINSHWIGQMHVTERSFLEMILWNVTIVELAIYISCFVATAIILALKFKVNGETAKGFLPIISVSTILILLYLESRKAVYYWTPITPFTSLLLAQTPFLCSEFHQKYNFKK